MKPVVPGLPVSAGPFVIAEAGVNHNGDVALARELVDAAADAGADAVKFQTFRPELVAAPEAPRAEYQRQEHDDTSQLDMIRRLALSEDAFRDLASYCRTKNIVFLSTPFDIASADFLVLLGVPVIKVPSGEISNLPFLRHVARLKKPIVMSTGMAAIGEVERAVGAIEQAGCGNYALLHCTSNYPAASADINLRAMATLKTAFGCPVGYSDHTIGIEIALAAAALGAQIIEKHFTLNRKMDGPDHAMSLEPRELADMVRGIRSVTLALGDGIKRPAQSETSIAFVVRRSLAAARPLPSGTVIEAKDLICLRPGTGIAPGEENLILGRRVVTDIRQYSLIEWAMVE